MKRYQCSQCSIIWAGEDNDTPPLNHTNEDGAVCGVFVIHLQDRHDFGKYAPPQHDSLFAWQDIEGGTFRGVCPLPLEGAIENLTAQGCGEVVLIWTKDGYVHPNYEDRLKEITGAPLSV